MRHLHPRHNPPISCLKGGRPGYIGELGRFHHEPRQSACDPFKAQPLTLCAYEVDCDDVLDLTDQGILTAHGIAPSDLAYAWKDLETCGIRPPSWILAERLMRDGIAGVVVPSYASGATADDINVVFWD